jgi:Na+-translocating ferredoxin:NAD+ oxidoreductase RnfG subunit
VLVVICLVVTALLLSHIQKHKQLDSNAQKTQEEAAKEVLGDERGKALEEPSKVMEEKCLLW